MRRRKFNLQNAVAVCLFIADHAEHMGIDLGARRCAHALEVLAARGWDDQEIETELHSWQEDDHPHARPGRVMPALHSIV